MQGSITIHHTNPRKQKTPKTTVMPNKKYSIKRMKDLFLEMLNLSATEKFKAIENAHVSWQNKNEQTDDILVFGFEMHSKKKQN